MESRQLRLVMTLVAAASVAGCSAPTPTLAPTPTVAATPAPARRTYAYADMVVGFIESGSQDDWHARNTGSFTDTAAVLSIALKPYDAGGQFANQIAAFHRFSADPAVNVIVLSATQASGYDDVLLEARTAGKVVIIEGQRIDADPSLYSSYIGSDYGVQGQHAAAAMCDLLRTSNKRNVAEIFGTANPTLETDRSTGFRTAMGDCGIVIPDGLSSAEGSTTSESQAVVSAWLKQSTDIQGVFAHSEEETIGAIQAIEAAGLKPGTDIQLVGIGEVTCDDLKYLISGELGAEIEYNPILGPQVYDAALKALNGDPSLPKWIPSQEGQFFASQGSVLGSCSDCPGYQHLLPCHSNSY